MTYFVWFCRPRACGFVWYSRGGRIVGGVDIEESLFHRELRVHWGHSASQSAFPGRTTTYNGPRKPASHCRQSVCRVCSL